MPSTAKYTPSTIRPFNLLALELIEIGASHWADMASLATSELPAPKFSEPALAALRAPFDAAMASYRAAVQSGMVELSMIGSRKFSKALEAIERAALGPLARSR